MRGAEVHGLTVPLLTSAAGEKMGKSAGNALWLDPALTSPFVLYQYFVNTADADAPKLLRLLTLLPDAAIADVLARHAAAPHLRGAQTTLAAAVRFPAICAVHVFA